MPYAEGQLGPCAPSAPSGAPATADVTVISPTARPTSPSLSCSATWSLRKGPLFREQTVRGFRCPFQRNKVSGPRADAFRAPLRLISLWCLSCVSVLAPSSICPFSIAGVRGRGVLTGTARTVTFCEALPSARGSHFYPFDTWRRSSSLRVGGAFRDTSRGCRKPALHSRG